MAGILRSWFLGGVFLLKLDFKVLVWIICQYQPPRILTSFAEPCTAGLANIMFLAWQSRKSGDSESAFGLGINSKQFFNLFLIMVISMPESPSNHNSVAPFFLNNLQAVKEDLGDVSSLNSKQKEKTSRKNPSSRNCRKLVARSTWSHTCGWPVLFNSTSNKTSCPTLGDPSLVETNYIRCSRYSRYSRYTINLFKYIQ